MTQTTSYNFDNWFVDNMWFDKPFDKAAFIEKHSGNMSNEQLEAHAAEVQSEHEYRSKGLARHIYDHRQVALDRIAAGENVTAVIDSMLGSIIHLISNPSVHAAYVVHEYVAEAVFEDPEKGHMVGSLRNIPNLLDTYKELISQDKIDESERI